jgi:uncharacterized membrane protein
VRARQATALLALAGAFVALYLTLYKMGVIGTLACSVGECETVNTSRYAMLVGLPIATWGLGSYALLFALATLAQTARFEHNAMLPRAIAALATWNLIVSAYLTYLELNVIHAICVWCVTSACITGAVFVTSMLGLRAAKSA